ncbi:MULTISPECIES: 4-hydroxy-tetrahydrodipicolinate synthase [Enterococcus]|uniref:4-hydroxy-tetrahydrodipicolinate synthase n=2 Tax=Enterococcus mundtii TaxID=53346 RepID=A0A2K8TBZ7_ENTMU|nr:4-hydroxy-tetrahydrodipicolinate synthase [Enterococcus mundtii]MBE6172622.1 4-hydroxy-tetrahydrodipicolinate synthase [Enterococcus faecium]GEN18166.1 4-hydroxy-tetrahydrodipicolinate synthase [Ligilactobacillus acidipiscis]AUB51660.1 4-hydroxy-tetrahydrodipicolinate synthase [Enterococcus mundtii]MBO1086936.1 4-hydroxy-tetrahydrodipicolinate synthase [Enterococcus mundtii]MCA6774582.1 4-hydroxy-tetrahydrodipicolinate synthase [Enterococcus mundtii]
MIKGSIVALVTPMTETGAVDYLGLEQLIAFHLKEQTDGLLVLGTTGESPTLSEEEEEEIVRFTVEKVNGRIPVIAGAGSNATAKTVKKVQRFAELGADQLLVITPYYNKTSDVGLLAHFKAIADASSLPIILYNVPSRTGMTISLPVLTELAKHPRIIGIKEASGDMSYTMEVAQLIDESFALYSGNDDLILPILSIGGIGVISVWANIQPKVVHEVVHDYLNGNSPSAKEKQLTHLALINALFSETNPIPVKAAMNHLGLPAGPLRLPLIELGEEKKQQLIALLTENGGAST